MMQQSAEWHAARCGRATASRFSDVMAKIRTGEAASRRNYKAELVAERLTGVPADSYVNAAMLWGIETEPQAREAYEAHSGNIVEQVAFVAHPDLMTGASPDGLIDLDGGLEIKCPNTAQHIDALLKGMPPEHLPQIQGGMWLTGRKFWDFVSFDPRMPERLQLYVQRVLRDDAYIANIEAEIRQFLSEVDKLVEQLEQKMA